MEELRPELMVARLGLVPLEPEGVFAGQTWRDAAASAIHYLMTEAAVSGLHRQAHLEAWAWHAGSPARMLLVSFDGAVSEPVLGPDLAAGERPQVVVPGGWWQACEPIGAWTLVSTFMAPPYADDAVTFAGGRALAAAHPAYAERILRLARD